VYHVCFELGRFPYELPAGLPDEQVELMLAYLAVRNEEQAGDTAARDVAAARAAEHELQAAEQAAWKTSRKVVAGG
jgi:hypothetical protein